MRNPIGRKVKIADLRDNLDVTRIPELGEKDLQRISKYKIALKRASLKMIFQLFSLLASNN
jgi:ABC-type methionine transport system ATPase subunit